MRPGRRAGALASPAGPMLPIDEPPLSAELIATRHAVLLARLRSAAERAGRDPGAFQVVAVTKGFDVAVVRAALAAGLRRFGENRVQEAVAKVVAVPQAEWHLVGRLQANKARPAVRAFAAIHSVDSLDLLARLDRIAAEERVAPRVLLQVNASAEATKGGFEMAWARDESTRRGELADALDRVSAIRVAGLMTIAPAGARAEAARAVFAALRELRDALEQLVGRRMPELSMGMTADAEAAVAEGATLVRIGTALFGPRPG
ncbi:MAG TPA: YggS family pyridoxal phosphate-dependent enzyme [Candidatus Limnocylindria bacterium]|nr:YggS family pyridoxal phosphate-dependent enzyme [Candidatus Limnocylindria bacterium]